MSEKLEELISLLYQDKLTQYGKRLLVENIKKIQKENELAKKQVEYDKTHICTPQIIKLNYIPVQKVKDKIEELKINLVNMQGEELLIYESKIDVLQELLESEE